MLIWNCGDLLEFSIKYIIPTNDITSVDILLEFQEDIPIYWNLSGVWMAVINLSFSSRLIQAFPVSSQLSPWLN